MREPIGTRIRVIKAEDGAWGANGKTGAVCETPPYGIRTSGLRNREGGFFVKLDDTTYNNGVWNIGVGAEYEVISRNNRIDRNTYVLSNKSTVTIGELQPNTTLIIEIKKNIKDVIYNNPTTVVLWKDGTKTVVKCQTETGDTYNPELGLAMCIIKKLSGNKGNYNDVFNKWLPKE